MSILMSVASFFPTPLCAMKAPLVRHDESGRGARAGGVDGRRAEAGARARRDRELDVDDVRVAVAAEVGIEDGEEDVLLRRRHVPHEERRGRDLRVDAEARVDARDVRRVAGRAGTGARLERNSGRLAADDFADDVRRQRSRAERRRAEEGIGDLVRIRRDEEGRDEDGEACWGKPEPAGGSAPVRFTFQPETVGLVS